jgi:hypothetical protein
LAPS